MFELDDFVVDMNAEKLLGGKSSDFPPFPLSLLSIILLPATTPTRCMNGLFVGFLLFNIHRLFAKAFGNVEFAEIEDALLA